MNETFEHWLNQGRTVIMDGLLQHYLALGLNETELVFVIQLQSYLDKGNLFPNMGEVAERMGKKEAEIFTVLHTLIQKKCVSITSGKDEAGKVSDHYSLTPLYQKLLMQFERKKEQKKEATEEINLLEVFQQEFGRLLTPMEMQTISEWLDRDRYSKELIMEALREAVLNQSYNFRYIDRILLSWEKKNIRTMHQAKEESKRFSQYQRNEVSGGTEEDEEDIPLFNWLDPQSN